MTKRNNRAKREARELAASTGMRYTAARRATTRPAGSFPATHAVSTPQDAVSSTAHAWVDHALIDSSLEVYDGAGQYVLDLAEAARAATSSLVGMQELIEELGYGYTGSEVDTGVAQYALEAAEQAEAAGQYALDAVPAAEYARDLAAQAEAMTRYVLDYAEVESAFISGAGVDRDVIEEYEDGLRLVSASFEVDISVRGLVASDAATDIVNRGLGRLVEESSDGAHVIMRPRTASVQLTVRVDEPDASSAEVLEVDGFTWLS
ncbi:hypothetical protein [Cellulomonas sp.]|uniref:hypothetical protein n=1 Tax=Cellulomonas sp. TaxID=40001 RepID=UPI002811FAE9|nr:hypothetical protein [Cellulomonas sp.]